MVVADILRIPLLGRTIQHQAGREFTVTYNSRQLGHTDGYVSSFLRRNDVSHALTHFDDPRLHLKRKRVRSPQGEAHDYLMLHSRGKKDRRKRIIFDEPTDPSIQPAPENSDGAFSLTLVVPHETMRRRGLLPKEGQHFKRFPTPLHAQWFLWTVQRHAHFAGRKSGAQVEFGPWSTDFIQPVPALVAKDTSGRRVLVSVRGTANEDPSLAGLHVLPVTMGHGDIQDDGNLVTTLHREGGEETQLRNTETKRTFPLHGIFHHASPGGRWHFSRYYQTRALGVVHLQETAVDKVHAGVIFVASPKTPHVEIEPHPDSGETVHSQWMSKKEYDETVGNGASWNKVILRHMFPSSAIRRAFDILKA